MNIQRGRRRITGDPDEFSEGDRHVLRAYLARYPHGISAIHLFWALRSHLHFKFKKFLRLLDHLVAEEKVYIDQYIEEELHVPNQAYHRAASRVVPILNSLTARYVQSQHLVAPLARAAAKEIPESAAVYLCVGSTIKALAHAMRLAGTKVEAVITPNSEVIAELKYHRGIRSLAFLGGIIDHDSLYAVADRVFDTALDTYQAQIAFFSGVGLTQEGLTDHNPQLVTMKGNVIHKVKKHGGTCMLLMPSTKLGQGGTNVTASLDQLDTIYVNDDPAARKYLNQATFEEHRRRFRFVPES